MSDLPETRQAEGRLRTKMVVSRTKSLPTTRVTTTFPPFGGCPDDRSETASWILA